MIGKDLHDYKIYEKSGTMEVLEIDEGCNISFILRKINDRRYNTSL